MTPHTGPAEIPLSLASCASRRPRGGHPPCAPAPYKGAAPVLWRGGEPDAGLGVEALRVDGAPAGCGEGERWLVRSIAR